MEYDRRHHIEYRRLKEMAEGLAAPMDTEERAHLAACEYCTAKYVRYGGTEWHPNNQQIVQWVLGISSDEMRWTMASHVLSCVHCRERREALARSLDQPVEATVLWNGGWDKLLVNPSTVRDLTASERKEIGLDIAGGGASSLHPVLGNWDWLLCYFIKGGSLGSPLQCVEIVERIDHGD